MKEKFKAGFDKVNFDKVKFNKENINKEKVKRCSLIHQTLGISKVLNEEMNGGTNEESAEGLSLPACPPMSPAWNAVPPPCRAECNQGPGLCLAGFQSCDGPGAAAAAEALPHPFKGQGLERAVPPAID